MYGFNIQVQGNFAAVVQRVTDALKTEGFGVLTDIDVQATMKAKLGIDGKPYPDIGLLLPCNVVVREDVQGKIIVGFMDPIAVLKLTDNPDIAEIAKDVRARLERVRDQLKG
jgi:uncharacterized protein (DUF302 family)